MWGQRTELVVSDWHKDVVYLVQFPRSASGGTVSPFALKVETWLRMADVPYKNVSNEFRTWSQRGQIPFVEYNGAEISDSSIIIKTLSSVKRPPMDEMLSARERGVARALEVVFDHSIWWACFYERAKDVPAHYTTEAAMGRHLTGLSAWLLPVWFGTFMQRGFRSRAHSVGIGRLSQSEVESQFRDDLTAITDIMADNRFIMGEQAATVDAYAYGHLVMHECCPVDTPLRRILHNQYPNVVAYLSRVRQTYWPDWSECTDKLSLHTQWQVHGEKEAAADAESEQS